MIKEKSVVWKRWSDKVFKYEDQMAALTDDQLKAKTVEFKERYQNGESLDSLLYEALRLSVRVPNVS